MSQYLIIFGSISGIIIIIIIIIIMGPIATPILDPHNLLQQ